MRPRGHPLKQLALSPTAQLLWNRLLPFQHVPNTNPPPPQPLSTEAFSLTHYDLSSYASLHTWEMARSQSDSRLSLHERDVRKPVWNFWCVKSVKAKRRGMNGSVPFDQNKVLSRLFNLPETGEIRMTQCLGSSRWPFGTSRERVRTSLWAAWMLHYREAFNSSTISWLLLVTILS